MLTVEAQVAGEVAEKGVRARAAARRLAFMSARVRNAALHAIAEAGCEGAIIGRALYEGAIDLRAAIEAFAAR